jgi:hypothetical protein
MKRAVEGELRRPAVFDGKRPHLGSIRSSAWAINVYINARNADPKPFRRH